MENFSTKKQLGSEAAMRLSCKLQMLERCEQHSFAKQTDTCHPELVWQREQAQRSELCDPVPRWAGSQDGTGNSPLSLTLSLKGRGNKAAFTLAETLITLGIIGVVAALTMPSLIAHHKKLATVTALKKVQSVMGQAVNMLALENGGTLAGLCDADESHDCFAEKLLPYLKKAKYCSADSNENKYCYGWQNSDDSDGKWHRPHIILPDGIALEIYHSDKNCIGTTKEPYKTDIKHCASFYADINGYKKPNIKGQDIFGFAILPNQVVPWGSPIIFEENSIPTAETCEKGNGQNLGYCTYYYLY